MSSGVVRRGSGSYSGTTLVVPHKVGPSQAARREWKRPDLDEELTWIRAPRLTERPPSPVALRRSDDEPTHAEIVVPHVKQAAGFTDNPTLVFRRHRRLRHRWIPALLAAVVSCASVMALAGAIQRARARVTTHAPPPAAASVQPPTPAPPPPEPRAREGQGPVVHEVQVPAQTLGVPDAGPDAATLERTAVDAIQRGDLGAAARIYDQLASASPENPAFKGAAEMLRRQLEENASPP